MSIISLINKFPFGNPAQKGLFLYKKVSQDFLRRLEEENFRKTIRFVGQRSPFYKKEFKKRKIDASRVQSPKDLGDFFTTPEDIRKNPDAFVCMRPDTAYESTGTTSKRTKRVYFSRTEVEEAGWAGAVGLWGLGMRPQDRVVSAFDYSFWVSGPVLAASCKILGCFHVEAGRITPEEFYERLADYRITVIVGDPSWLLRLSEIAEKKKPWPIKLMIGGGENLTEEARRYIEKVWKCDFILSYGQTEAFGAIGMESLGKDGYHLNGFHNYFEIINADAQGYGELVYTTANRRVMPLVRYRSGDITRFIEGPSKSGMPGKRIEKLKGRIDEWTPTALGNIAPWMFEPLFGRLADLGEDWQIAVRKEGNKDLLEFRMEAANLPAGQAGGVEDQKTRERFFAAFKEELPEAWKLCEMDLCKLDAKVLPKGALRLAAARKLRRIVDDRKF